LITVTTEGIIRAIRSSVEAVATGSGVGVGVEVATGIGVGVGKGVGVGVLRQKATSESLAHRISPPPIIPPRMPPRTKTSPSIDNNKQPPDDPAQCSPPNRGRKEFDFVELAWLFVIVEIWRVLSTADGAWALA
jgi:hypothetical protein